MLTSVNTWEWGRYLQRHTKCIVTGMVNGAGGTRLGRTHNNVNSVTVNE